MIVVTGASKGLGRAICERLLEKGFEVFGIARNVEGLSFPSVACDVSSYQQVKVVSQKLKKDGSFIIETFDKHTHTESKSYLSIVKKE